MKSKLKSVLINKWNGKLPVTMLGDKTSSMIGIK